MIHTCDEAKLRFYINEMTVPIHISNIDLNTQKHLMQLHLFLCVITVVVKQELSMKIKLSVYQSSPFKSNSE